MTRRRSSPSQADITRLIKAALAAGVGKEHIVGVRLDRDGCTVLFGEQKAVEVVKMVEPLADSSWGDVDAA